MNINFCYAMVAIAETQSLSSAAVKLFVTQSALSQQLHAMEKQLKAKLFVHQNNHMLLTPAGELFLQAAESIIATKESTYQQLAQGATRYDESLSLVVNRQTGSLFVVQHLPSFKARYPKVRVDIKEADTQAAIQLLQGARVDLALMGKLPQPVPLITEQTLYQEEIVLAVAPENPLTKLRTTGIQNLASLRDHEWILSQPGTHFRQLCDRILATYHIIPNLYCQLNNFFAVRRLVAQNYGIAFLHRSMIDDTVVAVPLIPRYRYPIVMAHHRATTVTAPMQYLISLCQS